MGVTDNQDNRKVNILITLIIWCVLCSVSMVGMLVVAADKTVVIETAAEDASGDVIRVPQDESMIEAPAGGLLELQRDVTLKNALSIPVAAEVKAEHVTVENHYWNHELWIYLKNTDDTFYRQNLIRGDLSQIEKCLYEVQEGGILVKIELHNIREYRSTMEAGVLKIEFFDPRDYYENIIVLDPIGGGEESGITAGIYAEKDVALQVAKLVQKKVTLPDTRVYLTRNEDITVSGEQRLQLIQEIAPDLFLQIGVTENIEDIGKYGVETYFNEEYYIPEFGNVEWADIVTREVTIASSNRALGLHPEAGGILSFLDMPAARLSMGYFTNEQECTLLQQDAYRDKLAEGIAEAVRKVFDEGK